MGIKLSKVAKAAKKYDHILIIMRHAKAEPFGDKGDSERELTDKGLKQAKAVGKGIESLGLVPDQISCSSATRTRQTLDRMLKTFGDKPIVDYRISLYDGGVQAVFDEFETQGELVHPFKDVDAEAMRSLGHIVGYVDLDVTGIVDLIVDTINKEL